MTKNYFYQVKPVIYACLLWCANFSFILFGNEAILFLQNGFLHNN